jgi:hypothetical protein
MLWRTFAEDQLALSEDGAVATQTGGGYSLTTTGTELTAGKHFWEVELLSENLSCIFIGISRPNLHPVGRYLSSECTDGWFIGTANGCLFGNGKYNDDAAGGYKQGDRVGVLLDLNNGSLRFFKNGVQHGPGYPAGRVMGPVVAAALANLAGFLGLSLFGLKSEQKKSLYTRFLRYWPGYGVHFER